MKCGFHHNGTTVYDYKGDMNANLDTNWSGGIMENWSVRKINVIVPLIDPNQKTVEEVMSWKV